nr:isoform 2 of snw/ski-interacting protein [Quercus suber]
MAESFTDVSNAPWFKQRHNEGFVPQKVEDFGDGGAFPETHIAQFPLNMGRVILSGGSKIEEEELQREIEKTTQETRASLEKILNQSFTDVSNAPWSKQRHNEGFVPQKVEDFGDGGAFPEIHIAQFPLNMAICFAAFNSGVKERIINILEMPADPLDPPKFKHKRLPKPSASASPPVPIMHSPPCPVTVKDQQDWKIPPCISNWINPKGYTIPLD